MYHDLPAWEVELLLAVARQQDEQAAAAGPQPAGAQPDPWQSPPDIAI